MLPPYSWLVSEILAYNRKLHGAIWCLSEHNYPASCRHMLRIHAIYYAVSMFSFATEFTIYRYIHTSFQSTSYITSKGETVDELGSRVRFPPGANDLWYVMSPCVSTALVMGPCPIQGAPPTSKQVIPKSRSEHARKPNSRQSRKALQTFHFDA